MRALEKRKIADTNEYVTFIGLGALEIGRDWGLGDENERKKPPLEEVGRFLNAILDLGINLIDTARAYHRSEERIGMFISHRRKEFFLASKCGEHSKEPDTYYDFSYNAIKKSIDLSLKLLKTDYIDLMQIHFGPDAEKVLKNGEVIEAILDAQKEGKIKYLGASCWGNIAEKCISMGIFKVMQLSYNLLYQQERKTIKKCYEKNISVFVKSPLAYGKLSPKGVKYLNSIGKKHREKIKKLLQLVDNDPIKLMGLNLNFLYKTKGITSVLIGTKNIIHFKEALNSLETDFSKNILEKAISICQN